MPEFAFIFRPTRVVPAADLPRRNDAAREWALARRRDGVLGGAHPLEDGGAVVTAAGVRPLSSERPVASVLVVAAADLDAAIALAKTHPGLAFGSEIEVRPVKAVAPPTP